MTGMAPGEIGKRAGSIARWCKGPVMPTFHLSQVRRASV